MAKFSFPLPGRKHNAASKEKEREKESRAKSSSGISNKSKSSNLSKAQRILGTDNDLNIDSPTRSDAHSWGYPSSSSGISISISESTTQSTRSTNYTEDISASNIDQWEQESDVFPKSHRVREKASSTVLGQQYGEDGTTDTSSMSRRMRHEGSDSTLKSYYDRQKSPLSVSQQTSASSARDLALRKGFPPVIPRSPLLQVDSINDPFDQLYAEPIRGEDEPTQGKSTRKKPARLDLSILFSKSRKSGADSIIMSPASVSTNASTAQNQSSVRRKLTKQPSKDSLQSQKHRARAPQPVNRTPRHNDTVSDYEHYDHLPFRSPPMGQIPETRVPSHEGQPRNNGYNIPLQAHSKSSRNVPGSNNESPYQSEHARLTNSYLSPRDGQRSPWKNVHSNGTSPQWEISSAASISSQNTKTSRHTSASAFSNSDLKQSSVLSLSSGSEGEDLVHEPKMSSGPAYDDKAGRMLNGTSQRALQSRRQSTQKHQVSLKQSSRKGAAKTSPFLTIPEASLPSSRISGPWLPPDPERQPPNTSQFPNKSDRKGSRKPSSVSSKRSSQHPTPPLSPISTEFQEAKDRSSRFMAVTKQEEALLEALRQKRAMMREKIIEEVELAKSPSSPRVPNRTTSRYSEASSVSTLRGPDSSKNGEHILLYLDTPISDTHAIDTAEPSPDLSDFLSFGSDEDFTPRTSMAVPRNGKARPDSSIRKSAKISPMTPPNAARLSAVGAIGPRGARSESKRRTPGVRFVDEGKMMKSVIENPPDFLMDEHESEVIWGM